MMDFEGLSDYMVFKSEPIADAAFPIDIEFEGGWDQDEIHRLSSMLADEAADALVRFKSYVGLK